MFAKLERTVPELVVLGLIGRGFSTGEFENAISQVIDKSGNVFLLYVLGFGVFLARKIARIRIHETNADSPVLSRLNFFKRSVDT